MKAYYKIIVHTQEQNYVSKPMLLDIRRVKRHVRKIIQCYDVTMLNYCRVNEYGCMLSGKRIFVKTKKDIK